jgi:hypothetical protein|tara:strand:+ start:552 stop:818 length:267 start_codon:yes stop_codon:yes gene_type:complete
MPLFQFRQNNSGGRDIGPKNVIIQADNAADANNIAQAQAKIYFCGVDKGIDCDCCGDRWHAVHDFDADDIWGVNMDNPNSDDFLKINC